MGQRANLIIVEGGKFELYYDHWCANRLDSYLFWGLDKSIQFFRAHDKQDDNWWLDNICCEGGAVIDLDKHVLLWFGGEDISFDIPLRRLLLELMRKTWQGFEILWAYEGIADLADYVGYDRNKVLIPFDEKKIFDKARILRIFYPIDRYWDSVISIHGINGETEIYTANIFNDLMGFLLYGPGILDIKKGAIFYTEYEEDTENKNTLLSGIHIDLCYKQIHIWSCFEEIIDFRRLQNVWDGYKVYFHKDKFEYQIELTDNKLRFAEVNRNDLINMVKSIVCIDSDDPFQGIISAVNHLDQHRDIKLNPAVYVASKFISDKSLQEELFDKLFME